jgi:mRNA-degrading endonuclease RelE of RelBE toxin-antitoxin system
MTYSSVAELTIEDYRVVYTFDQVERKVIIVHLVKHRKEVYKIKS